MTAGLPSVSRRQYNGSPWWRRTAVRTSEAGDPAIRCPNLQSLEPGSYPEKCRGRRDVCYQQRIFSAGAASSTCSV